MEVVLLLVLLAVGAGVAYLAIRLRALAGAVSTLPGQVFSIGNELGSRLSLARAERDQLRDHVDRLDEALGDLKEMLARLDTAQAAGDQRDQRAADEIVAMARQVEELARGQEDILGYLRSTLADEALAGAGDHQRRVIAASACSAQSEDLLRGSLQELCEAIGLESIFPRRIGRLGTVTYYGARNLAGEPVEVTLATLLAAGPNGAAPPRPGLEELRRLLIVLHAGGPGTVRVGPMIVNSTPGILLGCVTNPREMAGQAWAGLDCPAGGAWAARADRSSAAPSATPAGGARSAEPAAAATDEAAEAVAKVSGEPGPAVPARGAPAVPAPAPADSAAEMAAQCEAWLRDLEPGGVVDLTAWVASHLR